MVVFARSALASKDLARGAVRVDYASGATTTRPSQLTCEYL